MAPRKVIKTAEAPGVEAEPEIASTAVALIEPITERPTFIDLLVFPQKQTSLKIIEERKAEYAKVTINGVDDKVNYNLVVQQMSQMRDDRRAFENAAYTNVIDPLKDKLKEYAADIDEVVEAFKAAEKAERDKKDFIDNEKKRIKLEKEEAKARAVQVRISDLTRLGALFDGASYTFPYDGSLFINSLQVNDFEDDEWAEFLAEVNEAYDVEQKRLEQVEADRLQQIEDDKKKALEVAAQAQQNEADNVRLTERRTALRLKELRLMGASFDGETGDAIFKDKGDYVVPRYAIENSLDGLWDEMIYDLENFVPATDPLVKEEPQAEEPLHHEVHGYGSYQSHGDILASELGLGDHVETDIQDIDWEIIEKILTFSGGEPYIEFPISSKLFMRIFPDDTDDIATTTDLTKIANNGRIQDVLNWVIISKTKEE